GGGGPAGVCRIAVAGGGWCGHTGRGGGVRGDARRGPGGRLMTPRREQHAVRMLVLWCPDWPVVAACSAAGVPADRPAAVFEANRVRACSATARCHGVRRGMRRRPAQSRCPEIAVLDWDQGRDARLFEPV